MIYDAIKRLAQDGPGSLQYKDCDSVGKETYPNLQDNLEGRPVADLQTILLELGAGQIDTPNGYFGQNTREALEQFTGQPDYQLARGDLETLADIHVNQLIIQRASTDTGAMPGDEEQDEASQPDFPPRFLASVEPLLGKEGGFSNDPDDLGGMTFMGITRKWFPKLPLWTEIDSMIEEGDDPNEHVAEMTPYVQAFYLQEFWQPANCDAMFAGLDEQHLDFVVNAGSAATKTIQKLANIYVRENIEGGQIDEDGTRGPATTAAATALGSIDEEWHETVLASYKVLQGVHYLNLCQAKPNQLRFVKGWLLHRLEL